MEVLIPKQTAASTVTCNITKRHLPCTIRVDGVMAANTIAFNLIGINGTDTTPAYNDAASPAVLVLSATVPQIKITHPVNFQIVKGVATNAVGVMLVD